MSDRGNSTTVLHPSLKPGHFYWALPAHDVDTDLDWQNRPQPARFVGWDDEGRELWFWLGVEGEGPDGVSDWPAIWIGEEIQNG